jgi:hypothetical protein
MVRITILLSLLPTLVWAQVPPPAGGSFKTETFSRGRRINEKTIVTEVKGGPPSITYGSTRESKEWITNNQGMQVAVDEGVSWHGRKAYLSLTFDLIVVDEATKKTVWSQSVGAFWDTISFINQAPSGKPALWQVLLSSSRQPGYQQPFELETGKQLALIGAAAMPEGQPFTPRKVWSGSEGIADGKVYRLVTSAEQWTTLRAELFGDGSKALPAASDFDFTRETLLVCYAGKTTNWMAIDVELAVENHERVLLRLHRKTYQSMGKTRDEHPYGLIVLPKKPGKDVVLEYNRQNLIGGPPMWKEFLRLK